MRIKEIIRWLLQWSRQERMLARAKVSAGLRALGESESSVGGDLDRIRGQNGL